MKALDRIAEEALEDRWESLPVLATYAGARGYDDRIGDFSSEAVQDRLKCKRGILSRLRKMGPPAPSDREASLDYRTLAGHLESQAAEISEFCRIEKDPSLYPLNAIRSVHVLFVKDFPEGYRREMVRARLGDLPQALRAGMGNIRRPDRVLSQVALEAVSEGKLFLRQAAGRHDPRGARAALEALEDYGRFLRERTLPKARTTFPLGRELFELKLKKEHGLDLTASELEERGWQAIRHTRSQLAALARSIDPHASWRGILHGLKKRFPSPKNLLGVYRSESKRVRDFTLGRGLVTFPRQESLRILPTPRFEWDTVPYAAMNPPGAFDRKQDSIFWVTPVDPRWARSKQVRRLKGHCLYGVPITCLHEGYPGHHIQLARGNLIRSKVRRVFHTPVLVEGWAFYCEEMMEEVGYLTDPWVRLYRLKDQLWRACRIVVDVGLHTRKMSYLEAIRFLVEEADLEEPNARAEVNRYCGSPTQPMSYLIGKGEILRLRDRCRQAWGPAYSLRRFHDWLLDFGSIPPSWMEPYVENRD